MCPWCRNKLYVTIYKGKLAEHCPQCNVYWKDKKIDEMNEQISKNEALLDIYLAIQSAVTPVQFIQLLNA